MDFDAALAFLRTEIDKDQKSSYPLPEGFLRAHVTEHSALASLLEDDLAHNLIRHLETIYGTVQDDGHTLTSDFEEWYPQRKADIDFYYWRRLQKYWLDHSVLPVQVVKSVDNVTDEILGYLGDPEDASSWGRRGLVMGHVQSGKTTNYSALITKAADAGYRIIIVLAGLTKSLRHQTQVRLDQTFVGRSSLGDNMYSKIYPVALVFAGMEGEEQTHRHPFCGTTQDADFSVNITRGIRATEGNFVDPILFVTKKHEKVLDRLAVWLRGLQNGNQLEGPMLLIDDEADNASINTEKDPLRTTRINERIRTLLQCCRRSSYVGYTATPFANIFIDPDTEEDMLKEDLFPRHFIKSLEPPDNYIGASNLFADDGDLSDTCIRIIKDDYQDLLPLKHKSDLQVPELPESLLRAVRQYLIFRCLRILAGDANHHSSMLVNVSRFNSIQQQVHDHIYRLLQEIKRAVDVWGNTTNWGRSDILNRLHAEYLEEYAETREWDEIRQVLKEAVSTIEVRLVNMQGGGINYTDPPATGCHVIAVGGLALARGLTLEGLGISYVLRNVGAADTLLQMGRWFGYRPGYERLCRIHVTDEMQNHFREVSESVEELRSDLVRMEKLRKTPNDFGLKVRQSPTGIAITAANKMRTAAPLYLAMDFSNKHIQAYSVFDDPGTNRRNMDAARRLIEALKRDYSSDRFDTDSAVVWVKVDVAEIVETVKLFELPRMEFEKMRGDSSIITDYIEDRSNNELAHWDVAIPHKRTSYMAPALKLPINVGDDLFCRERFSAVWDHESEYRVVKFTGKNVVADLARNDLLYGENGSDLMGRAEALSGRDPKWSLERRLAFSRARPLLIVHFINLRLGEDENKVHSLTMDPSEPVVTLSLVFPDTSIPITPREYAATIRLKEILDQQRQESETDEELSDE